jgi:hypothetical protein
MPSSQAGKRAIQPMPTLRSPRVLNRLNGHGLRYAQVRLDCWLEWTAKKAPRRFDWASGILYVGGRAKGAGRAALNPFQKRRLGVKRTSAKLFKRGTAANAAKFVQGRRPSRVSACREKSRCFTGVKTLVEFGHEKLPHFGKRSSVYLARSNQRLEAGARAWEATGATESAQPSR